MRIALFFICFMKLTKTNLAALITAGLFILEYFGFGAVIFKNMWYTSPALPVLCGIAALLPVIAEITNIFIFKRRWADVTVICVSLAFALGYFFFFAYVISKLLYFLIAGKPYFITAFIFSALAFFIFLFPRLSQKAKRASAITVCTAFAFICLFGIFNATPFYVSAQPAVFAVEDEYQIAFATSHNSAAEVTVNGKTYTDSVNGQKIIRPLHKISVPSSELDRAGGYTIAVQSVILNTAYAPSKGVKISKTYSFRPVDSDDGLQMYNISDTHDVTSGPAKAGSYFGEKLDLLILNGDIISDVSSYYQISLIYKLAHKITKGGLPVIFTRGNHECNGPLAATLGEYVGCAERGFYYTVKTGEYNLVILDTNNDMSDGNPLISPIADFDRVRAEQSQWLKGLDLSGENNIIISHIAYPLSGYVSEKCHWHGWARELVSLTDNKVKLAVCGHSHVTKYEQAGSDDNRLAHFPVVRGSIRSNRYADKAGVAPYEFTGTAIEIDGKAINIKFTNAEKRVLRSIDV